MPRSAVGTNSLETLFYSLANLLCNSDGASLVDSNYCLAPSATMAAAGPAQEPAYSDDDILRIIISTDNHVGFMERDPVRGNDSFLAFEEVLHTAQQKQVDMVVLAGDLFHENRPTSTMEIVRKYVLGSNPVRVQLESSYDVSRILRQRNKAQKQPDDQGAGASSSGASKRRRADVDDDFLPKQKQAKINQRIGAGAGAGAGASSQAAGASSSAATDRSVSFAPGSGAAGVGSRHGAFDKVNWQDPHYNVELPLFTIHGNHDDPTRDGPPGSSGASLSALDLLSMSNLVNYFGKPEAADSMAVAPVLLRKGKTRMALYGVGGMREEHIVRAFNSGSVEFLRPPGQADTWFSMLLLHQNREARSQLGKVHTIESLLPPFFDIVIWGHEHECKPGAFTAVGIRPDATGTDTMRATKILQPGSTVATSLCEGEAAQKHCFLLEVKGYQFRRTAIPLRCVRPFRFSRLVLLDPQYGLDPANADVGAAMEKVLREKVEEQLKLARAYMEELKAEGLEPPPSMRLPLVRVVVDHSDLPVLQGLARFGSAYVGRVANPADILLFTQKRRVARPPVGAASAAAASSSSSATSAALAAMRGPLLPSQLNSLRVEDLVKRNLAALERDKGRVLGVLGQRVLEDAVAEYMAGGTGSVQLLKDSLDGVIRDTKAEALKRAKDKLERGVVTKYNRDRVKEILATAAMEAAAEAQAQADDGKTDEERAREADARRTRLAMEGRLASGEDQDDVAVDQEAGAGAGVTRGRGRGRGRGAAAGASASRGAAASGRGRGRGGGAASAEPKRPAKSSARAPAHDDYDRDNNDDDDLVEVEYEDWDDLDGTGAGAGASRAAPAKAKAPAAKKPTAASAAAGRPPQRAAASSASRAMAGYGRDDGDDDFTSLEGDEEAHGHGAGAGAGDDDVTVLSDDALERDDDEEYRGAGRGRPAAGGAGRAQPAGQAQRPRPPAPAPAPPPAAAPAPVPAARPAAPTGPRPAGRGGAMAHIAMMGGPRPAVGSSLPWNQRK